MEALKDTIYSLNGKFSYEPQCADTSFMYIIPRKGIYKRLMQGEYHPSSNQIIFLWISNQKIGIKDEFTEHFIDYEIEGCEFNRNHSLIRRKSLKNLEQEKLIEIKIDSLFYHRANKHLIDSLFKERLKESNERCKIEMEYLLNNTEAELSGYYLLHQPLDTVAKYHNRLSNKVRNGLFKNRIDSNLETYNQHMEVLKNKSLIQAGNIAPNFILPSIAGDSLSLYSIDSEFTVLDFWGTWCGPCISGLPKMKEYYTKYHKAVEFIGISCHDTESEWKKTVDTQQLKWKHVISFSQDVPVKYAIESYPTKIILDKDKKIIAVFHEESPDFYNKFG